MTAVWADWQLYYSTLCLASDSIGCQLELELVLELAFAFGFDLDFALSSLAAGVYGSGPDFGLDYKC